MNQEYHVPCNSLVVSEMRNVIMSLFTAYNGQMYARIILIMNDERLHARRHSTTET